MMTRARGLPFKVGRAEPHDASVLHELGPVSETSFLSLLLPLFLVAEVCSPELVLEVLQRHLMVASPCGEK